MCSGGSALIGGTPDDRIGPPGPGADPAGGGTTEIPLPDGKFSMSRAIAVTSSYVVGSHDPPHRSVCAIGQRSRSSAQMP